MSKDKRQLSFSILNCKHAFLTSGEQCLETRSDINCNSEFKDDFFPRFFCAKKSTVSRLVKSFRDTGSVRDRNPSGRPPGLKCSNANNIRGHFQHLTLVRSSFYVMILMYFRRKITLVKKPVARHFSYPELRVENRPVRGGC